jgi:sugar phosphate isomerase/epimerase
MKLAVQENMIPGKSFLEKLQNAEKYGFEGVEVWGTNLLQRLEIVKSALSTSKLAISTVCSGYEGDLLGSDRKTRETAIKSIKDLLKVSTELGAVGVITVPTFGGPKIPDLYPWRADVNQIEREILIEEYKILGKYAEEVGAYVILEPLNRYETHLINRLEQAADICKAVNNEYVKIMCDFFHMNIEEIDIPSSIKKVKDWVVNVHLADSNRLLPGYGHIDFKNGFAALKEAAYKYFMALECKIPGNPEIDLPKCVTYLKQLI